LLRLPHFLQPIICNCNEREIYAKGNEKKGEEQEIEVNKRMKRTRREYLKYIYSKNLK
jgi:hypothetical protein